MRVGLTSKDFGASALALFNASTFSGADVERALEFRSVAEALAAGRLELRPAQTIETTDTEGNDDDRTET